jgi:ATP-dependent protease ClpP protease subunit
LPGHSWYSITNSADDVADVAIYGEIGFDGVTHSDFANELRTVTAKNITLRINSPGGSVDEGIGIYNAIKDHPAKVTGYVEAAAHSIASVILQAADKRVMAPHSRMMIHRAMAGGAGFTIGYDDDFDELARQAGQVAAQLRETSDNIASIYSERSGKDSAYWLGKMKAETRFTDKADEIKAEMEAVADTEAEPKLAIPEDHLANLESLAGDVLAAVKAIRESNKAPEPEPDPRDAARRDLETALARVKL